ERHTKTLERDRPSEPAEMHVQDCRLGHLDNRLPPRGPAVTHRDSRRAQCPDECLLARRWPAGTHDALVRWKPEGVAVDRFVLGRNHGLPAELVEAADDF